MAQSPYGIPLSAPIPGLGRTDRSYDGGIGIVAPPPIPSPADAGLAAPTPGTGIASPPKPYTQPIPQPVQPPATPAPVATPTPAPVTTPAPTGPVTGNEQLRPITNDDLAQIQGYMDTHGIKITRDWRQELAMDPVAFAQKYWNLQGLGGYVHNTLAIKGTDRTTGPINDILSQQKNLLDQATSRLTESSAFGSRGDEQALLAQLSSMGLLDSGMAAKEVEKFREFRQQGLSQAIQALNEQFLAGGINTASSAYLDRLLADLNLRNQTYLQNQQEQILKNRQGSPFVDIAGQLIGATLPYLLSAKAPGTATPNLGTPSLNFPPPGGIPVPGPTTPGQAQPYYIKPGQ